MLDGIGQQGVPLEDHFQTECGLHCRLCGVVDAAALGWGVAYYFGYAGVSPVQCSFFLFSVFHIGGKVVCSANTCNTL
jgi:hypothetical protein